MKWYWEKLGRIYKPDVTDVHPKLLSHAANPLPMQIEGDTYRVFFSGRDDRNRSSVGAVDIDIIRHKILKTYHSPLFQHGPIGSFYADGVSIGNCYVADGVCYMLFMGWQAPLDNHWRGDIGRLIVDSNLSLTLDSKSPFLGIDSTDPISLSYPWVIGNDEKGFSMWYGSTITWNAGNGEMLHAIKYATSPNGQEWIRQGLAIPYELGIAQAFSKPSVVSSLKGGFDMWFSYRSGMGEKYRIGYAHSSDGLTWSLDLNNAGIDVSESGWDSEMIEYPFIFDHQGERYMLYNGNGYGKTGFGLARLVMC
jgi:hypothetical protein